MLLWEDTKDNPPKGLNISQIAMIPHKTRRFRAIIDLSYTIKLMEHKIEAVNDTTTKTAPQGAMNQMGYVINHMMIMTMDIHQVKIKRLVVIDVVCWY